MLLLWSNWFHLSDDLFKINDSNFKQIMTRETERGGDTEGKKNVEKD